MFLHYDPHKDLLYLKHATNLKTLNGAKLSFDDAKISLLLCIKKTEGRHMTFGEKSFAFQ
jgi:hypothetical protein